MVYLQIFFSHYLTLALVSWFLHTLNASGMGHIKTFEIGNTWWWSTCHDEDILPLNLSWVLNHFCILAVLVESMSNHLILPVQFFNLILICGNLHHWKNSSQMSCCVQLFQYYSLCKSFLKKIKLEWNKIKTKKRNIANSAKLTFLL